MNIEKTIIIDNNEISFYVEEGSNMVYLSPSEIGRLYNISKSTVYRYIIKVLNNSEEVDTENEKVDKAVCQILTDGVKNDAVIIKNNAKFYGLDTVLKIGELLKSNKGLLFCDKIKEVLIKRIEEIHSNIKIYSNGQIKLDVNVSLEEDTVWLNQNQIAELFETSQPNISMHVQNILNESELTNFSVHKDFLYTASDGKQYSVAFYNLDMILAIGYRVKGKRAIEFRKWATSVLKSYMINGYAIDEERLFIARNFNRIDAEIDKLREELMEAKNSGALKIPNEKIFYDGQFFDAHELMIDLLLRAKETIILIDPYFDSIGLELLEKLENSIVKIIVISDFSKLNKGDVETFEKQYGKIEIRINNSFHDRFLIIDNKECYSLGASLNRMGNKVFGIYKYSDSMVLKSILERIDEKEKKS